MRDAGDDMILLFGMPRSGTTWVGKTFDSHPSVAYRHEPDSQLRLNPPIPLLPDLADRDAYKAHLIDYCRQYLPRCSPRACGKRPVFPKAGETPLRRRGREAMILVAKALERAAGRPLSWRGTVSGRLVWKSIESVGRLGLILGHYPESRGVLILRDPRGYVASVLRGEAQKRFQGTASAADDSHLLELLCETRYARSYGVTLADIQRQSAERRLAWMWVLFNQKALDDTADLPNGQTVRYEDLCAQPEEGFRSLFHFCGLEWHSQTQQFVQTSTRGENATDDFYSVFKRSMESANRWRRELTVEQIAAVDSVVAEHPVGRVYLPD
jgi:hypothetical protein